jgi:aryl sulfotransferase
VPDRPRNYKSDDDDNGRWLGFPFRDGDIVISSRSKTGTTWVQMICALLIFQTPDLPDSLANLSPWLDWLIRPQSLVYDQLAAQRHRRFMKTHTPLDGLPADPRVTFIVPGRHPLDTAVSLYHHSANLDRDRIRLLSGHHELGIEPQKRPPLHEWLVRWVDDDSDPTRSLDSLPGILWHVSDAWSRRHTQDVVLVHYDDLLNHLDAQMRMLAQRLHLDVPPERWAGLIDAARFDQMRSRASSLAPDPAGIFKDREAFFRRGSSGAGRETLTKAELEHYERRVASMASPDVLEWLHRGSIATTEDRPG